MLLEKLVLRSDIYSMTVETQRSAGQMFYIYKYKNYNYDLRIIPADLNQMGI